MSRRQWIHVSLSQIWVGQLGSISGGETGSRSRRGSPSPIPTESAVSLLHTHTHTYSHSKACLGYQLRPHKNAHYSELNLPSHFLLNNSFCDYDFSHSFMRLALPLLCWFYCFIPFLLQSCHRFIFSIILFEISLISPFLSLSLSLLSVITVEKLICSV